VDKEQKIAMGEVVKKTIVALFILPLLLSCSSTNSSVLAVEKDNSRPSSKTIDNKPLVSKVKHSITKKTRASKEQPQELARVCFDKSGKAHNCSYKIQTPYKSNSTSIGNL
jgi:hypothetical protein